MAQKAMAQKAMAHASPPLAIRSLYSSGAVAHRSSSVPVPIRQELDAARQSADVTATAASLHARASDAAHRDYVMWRRLGSPNVAEPPHDGDEMPTRVKESSCCSSFRTVAFDFTNRLDGEEVLFALDV